MRDVTDLMNRYRIVARSIWNTGFWPVENLRTWDARDQFEQIKKLLLKAIVLAPLDGGHCCDLYSLADRILRVVPSGPVPIMIHRPREADRNWYWDDPVDKITAADGELHFLDYFDWDDMNYADFQYCRVRIAAFPAHPELIGREALLEHQYARVFVATSDHD